MPVKIDYENEHGVMDLSLEKGVYNISAKFTETPIRIFADLITLAGIVYVLFGLFRITFPKVKQYANH